MAFKAFNPCLYSLILCQFNFINSSVIPEQKSQAKIQLCPYSPTQKSLCLREVPQLASRSVGASNNNSTQGRFYSSSRLPVSLAVASIRRILSWSYTASTGRLPASQGVITFCRDCTLDLRYYCLLSYSCTIFSLIYRRVHSLYR
jgi:hypothetical protein